MLRLAVATAAETLARIREPLADRGIEAVHVTAEERSIPLADPPADFEGFDVGFVYPTRLMEGAVVDAFLGVPWVNGRDAVLASRNKAGTIARLGAAGLPTPETVLVSNPADDAALREAFEHVGAPVVVKPNSTTRGIGVARADDLDSYLGICDYLEAIHEFRATGDKSFLVQEYLPDATDYRVMVLDGEYAGAVERRLPDEALAAGQWKHNVHRDAVAEGVDLDADLRELAEAAARTLELPYCGVDLLVSDGAATVTETAARPTIDDASKYEPGFYDRLAALIRETAERGEGQ
ncbi:MAG: RimK family alpha-L-glutamate ligase [Halobacteriales archaeon]|nr:RimK family alpha-L-glutamate ligase [Halobacteriales archaeon]